MGRSVGTAPFVEYFSPTISEAIRTPLAPLRFYASEIHYAENLLPVWRGYKALYGVMEFYVHQTIWSEARRLVDVPNAIMRGHPIRYSRNPSPVAVASFKDYLTVKQSPVIYFEHGIGQTYSGFESGSYAGGPGKDKVVAFLCPNQHVADLNRAVYPNAHVDVVGCPLMDDLLTVKRARLTTPPTAAISFHWSFRKGKDPCMMPAFDSYKDVLSALRDTFRLIGHAHPRARKHLFPVYESYGIPTVANLQDLAAQTNVLIIDNSSIGYHFAGLGIPTVWLDIPEYESCTDHPRFDGTIPGLMCNRPEDLVDIINSAVADPAHTRKVRNHVNSLIFPHLDRMSGIRAAEAIRRVQKTL